jgi:3'-5' exonuclease
MAVKSPDISLKGKYKEIADYCETDIVNTYRLWLRYELFRGALTPAQFHVSEQKLAEFIKLRSNTKPHLDGMVEVRSQ